MKKHVTSRYLDINKEQTVMTKGTKTATDNCATDAGMLMQRPQEPF